MSEPDPTPWSVQDEPDGRPGEQLAAADQNMAQRMTQVEMALQEVLQHVHGLSVKAEA